MTIDHFPNRTARDREAETVRALTDRHTRERAALARVETLAEAIDRKILADVQVEDMHHALAVVVRTYSRVFLFGFDEGSAGAKMEFYSSLYNDPSDLDEGELPDEQNDTGLTVRDDGMDACIAKALDIIAANMTDTATTESEELHAIADGIDGAYVWNSGGDVLLIPVHRKTWSIQFSFVSGTLGWSAVSHAAGEGLDSADGSLLEDGGSDLDSSETAACIAYCTEVIAEQDRKRAAPSA